MGSCKEARKQGGDKEARKQKLKAGCGSKQQRFVRFYSQA